MPFGSFEVKGNIRKREKNAVQEKKEKPVSVPEWKTAASVEIPILLIGSSGMLMRDYLCSLKQNMDEVLAGGELSYYTKEQQTIQDMIAAKKQIEACFWDSQEERLLCGSEEENTPAYYTFSISPAGRPQISVDLCFCYMTPDQAAQDAVRETGAVWILAEGMDFRTMGAKEEADEYEEAVKKRLSGFGEADGTALIFLISQFEYLGRFRGDAGAAELDGSLRQELYRSCRKLYGEMPGQWKDRASMCQVQIYGGLEHFRKNAGGEWVQRPSRDGYFQSYVPVGCHMPVYRTIQMVKEQGGGFFDTELGQCLWLELQKNFSGYLANTKWQFADITEGETK